MSQYNKALMVLIIQHLNHKHTFWKYQICLIHQSFPTDFFSPNYLNGYIYYWRVYFVYVYLSGTVPTGAACTKLDVGNIGPSINTRGKIAVTRTVYD